MSFVNAQNQEQVITVYESDQSSLETVNVVEYNLSLDDVSLTEITRDNRTIPISSEEKIIFNSIVDTTT
jgi:hypothetical protein